MASLLGMHFGCLSKGISEEIKFARETSSVDALGPYRHILFMGKLVCVRSNSFGKKRKLCRNVLVICLDQRRRGYGTY